MKKNLNDRFSYALIIIGIAISFLNLEFIRTAYATEDITITTSSVETVYDQSKGAVVIAPELTISGPQDTIINKAEIEILNDFDSKRDILIFQNPGCPNIKGLERTGYGKFELYGNDMIQSYEKALQSVYFKRDGQAKSKAFSFNIYVNNIKVASANKTVTIRTINTTPIIKLSNQNKSFLYTEKEPFRELDEGIKITDADNGNIASAAIFVFSNFLENEDLFQFADRDGITGVYDESKGRISLTGIASVDEYQQVFRSICYKNTSNNPSILPRIIKYYIKDDCGAEAIETLIINIQAVNDLPEIITNQDILHFTEGDETLYIDSGMIINDIDSEKLASAQVWIKEGYEEACDILEYVEVEGISAAFDNKSGKLNISGTTAKEKYQQFLRNVRFHHSSKTPSNAERLIELTVIDDSGGISLSVTKVIKITPVKVEEETPVDNNTPREEEPPIDSDVPDTEDKPSDNVVPSDNNETPIVNHEPTINKNKKEKADDRYSGNITKLEVPSIELQSADTIDSLAAFSYIAHSFIDISSCPWAEKEIAFITSLDIMKFEDPERFEPYKKISRAEFIYGVMKLLNLNAQGESGFIDVEKDSYYYEAIAAAKALGIVHGMDSGILGANEPITRQDMITIAARVMKKTEQLRYKKATSALYFKDYDLIAKYAKESIELFVREGIIRGDGKNLNPNHFATRAEAAVLLFRLYERQLNK